MALKPNHLRGSTRSCHGMVKAARPSPPVFIGVAMILVGIVLAATLSRQRATDHVYSRRIPFDSARWRKDPKIRVEMLDDLFRHLNQSLTETQLRKMVGEPSGKGVGPNGVTKYFYEAKPETLTLDFKDAHLRTKRWRRPGAYTEITFGTPPKH